MLLADKTSCSRPVRRVRLGGTSDSWQPATTSSFRLTGRHCGCNALMGLSERSNDVRLVKAATSAGMWVGNQCCCVVLGRCQWNLQVPHHLGKHLPGKPVSFL